MTFLEDLKRRKMVQWTIAYAAFAVVVLEVADFLSGAFAWEAAALRVLTVIVAFGFLCVLVLAWFHGEQGHQGVRPAEVALLLLVVLAGGAVAWEVGTGRILGGDNAAEDSAFLNGAGDLVFADRAELDPTQAAHGIAVLPFVAIGGDGEDRAFADGITEDIIAQLGRIGTLRVISRTSVMGYRDTEKPIRQIGQELGVDVVLEGSIRVEGNRARIVAQLIDARTDEHLWAETYDSELSDVLQVQADVARKIAEALQTTLTPEAQQWLASAEGHEADPEALSLFQQGRRLADSDDPADRQKAADLLRQAVAIDSTLTGAWTALAQLSAPDPMRAPAAPRPDAGAIVEKAVSADPQNPQAHLLAGVHQAVERGDLDAAERSVRAALRLNPNDAEARRWLGRIYTAKGEPERGLREYRIAQRVDPRSAEIRNETGELLIQMGRLDEATAELRQAVRLDSSFAAARGNLTLAFTQLGMPDSAILHVRHMTEFVAQPGFGQAIAVQALAATGRREEARQMAESVEAEAEAGRVPPIAVAHVWLALDDTAAARPWIERAGEAGKNLLRLRPGFQQKWGPLVDVPVPPSTFPTRADTGR